MVFPTFFNLSLNFAIKSSWSEPQSVPSLVFADCIQLLYLWLQRIWSIWFWYWPSGDVHVQSCLLCCWKRVFAMTHAFSWQNSVSLWPASFCTPRLNLPVTPGSSWLPHFAFQSPIKKWTSFGGVSSSVSRKNQTKITSLELKLKALVIFGQTMTVYQSVALPLEGP